MTSFLAALVITAPQQYDWKDIVQPAFKDAKFVAKVISGNQKELKKVNDDFAQSYRFTTTTAYLKEPFMLRMEAEVEDTKLMYIVNGGRKYYKIGSKIGIPLDVSKAPGKRQTVFDFGILTPALFQNFMEAKFIRTERNTNELVFDITYIKSLDDSSRYRIWVDPAKKVVNKRVWFNQEGRQLATFDYDLPKNEGGVWFPTKCTVRNNDSKVAGVTEYQKVTINKGVDQNLFKF